MRPKPRVGVSRCLIGDAVRYDGRSKPEKIIIEVLSNIFELITICPELEAGLGVPRPPVQLVGSKDSPRAIGRDEPGLDVTETLHDFCNEKIPDLAELSGYIFKSRSPSCGLNTAPLFDEFGSHKADTNGIFANHLVSAYPLLPVIDELDIGEESQRLSFIEDVNRYHEARSTDLG